jgi:hypothetical protein
MCSISSGSGFRVGTDRQPPRCGGVTECDRNVRLRATRLGTAPLAQQRHGLRELHLVIELGEANHVPAAATAVAVEQVFVGVHQEAWFVIFMQRAQPHPSATAEWPRRAANHAPADSPSRNLLFQVVESLTIHGLLASMGRIRQTALRSQARMVGARKKCWPMAPAFTQHHTLSSAVVPIGAEWMDRASATDLCSAVRLARRNRRRRSAHRPAVGNARLKCPKAPANRARS